MAVSSLNGTLFEEMLKNALNNIRKNEQKINNMNVFPVPDGDTGSNMRVTLENGVVNTKSNEHLGDYLKDLSKNMLIGARGNSGVILSQLFRGIYEELKRCSIANAGELRDAFINAYKMAYKAVTKPTEGTILTVAREGIENIKEQINRFMNIDVFLAIYIAEMKKTLSYTPELLPILKESGVLDSGGAGYIVIIEGLLMYLQDDIIDLEDGKVDSINLIENPLFNSTSVFSMGYKVTYHLQLLDVRGSVGDFSLDEYIKEHHKFANNITISQEGTIVIAKEITLYPALVIESAQKYGEFVSFSMENLELSDNKKEKKLLGKIAVASGEEIKKIYKDLGCDVVIDGGKSMNAYSSDFISALQEYDCDHYVIFPNDKNNLLAINQAVDFLHKDNVTVIKTNNVLEGYYALANDVNDNSNLEYRISAMEEAKNMLTSLLLFTSVRDCTLNSIEIKKGDKVVMSGDLVLASTTDPIETLINGLNNVDEIEDKSVLIIFKGKDYEIDDEKVLEAINNEYPDLEVSFIDGGQPVYEMIIGLL